jgi:hypothetical protein
VNYGQEEEVQAREICNIFNKIMPENFPNLKSCPFKYRKPPGHQTDMTKIEPLHSTLSLKQLSQRAKKEY